MYVNHLTQCLTQEKCSVNGSFYEDDFYYYCYFRQNNKIGREKRVIYLRRIYYVSNTELTSGDLAIDKIHMALRHLHILGRVRAEPYLLV